MFYKKSKLTKYISVGQQFDSQALPPRYFPPPALWEGHHDVPKPAKKNNLISVSWVFPRASSDWSMRKTPQLGVIQEASQWAWTTSFTCEGESTLLLMSSKWADPDLLFSGICWVFCLLKDKLTQEASNSTVTGHPFSTWDPQHLHSQTLVFCLWALVPF